MAITSKKVVKAIFYGLVYFAITGLIPLVAKAITQIFGVVLDFEPRTLQWIFYLALIIGFLVFFEKLIEEDHPTGAGVFGIARYVVGLIDVTLYYNLLLHVGIIVPTIFPNMGVDPFDPTQIQFTLNLAMNNVFFALYLVTLGALIYGGYVLNFFRYIYQMAAGFKLTEE
ncbi:MAG: hypothetical protein HWN67_04190 [Candidatus Helarchaeota archaeon]|nr:hypothetical protein [Candidatus Helarchaeota archaeon]